MVEDIPDDLVHELFTESYWPKHPLGRSILGSPASVNAVTGERVRSFFERVYVADHLVIAAAGHIEHGAVRDLIGQAFEGIPARGEPLNGTLPTPQPRLQLRDKEIEQSHICLGTHGYAQDHENRYASYLLNTVLGSSMSSRLFQNVRDKRGLAYAVNSSLVAYRDVGTLLIYAGCDAGATSEVVDLVVAELRNLKRDPISSRGAAAGQGPSQRQPRARARKHHEPNVAACAFRNLLQSSDRSGRKPCRARPGHRGGCAACGDPLVLERRVGRDRPWAGQRDTRVGGPARSRMILGARRSRFNSPFSEVAVAATRRCSPIATHGC